jgi:hypothetical protein
VAGEPSGRRRHDPDLVRSVPPAPSSVDLHTHTLRSDGILEPAELVAAAAAAGVRVLSITDHDSLAAVRELRSADAIPPGLTLIPGVEINAVTRGAYDGPDGELHILGYGVDPADEAFEAALASQRDARQIRFERAIGALRALGLPIDDQVAALDRGALDSLGRPTIARCLVAAGHATSVDDAFRRLLGRGRPAYVARDGLDPLEAIAAIRAAGGIASLAHFAEAADHPDVLDELQTGGLVGLEVHYRAFDAETTERLAEIAAGRGLLATGGSDYHGDTGTYAEHHAALWVPPAVGRTLLERLQPR